MEKRPSWFKKVAEARTKAEKVIAGESDYESVHTPPDYNPTLFISIVLLFLADNWKISMEQEYSGKNERIFKITHGPRAVRRGLAPIKYSKVLPTAA